MKNKMLWILILSTLIMFGSIFRMNSKSFAFGMTQYVIVIAACTISNLSGTSLSKTVKHNSSAHDAAIPAVTFGIVIVILMIATLWFK